VDAWVLVLLGSAAGIWLAIVSAIAYVVRVARVRA
jgi:predicted lipase